MLIVSQKGLLAMALAVLVGGAVAQPPPSLVPANEEELTWQSLLSFSTRSIPQPKSLLVGGKVYVMSGHSTTVYDPATNTYDYSKTAVPTPRDNVAFETVDGKIYAMGGMSGSKVKLCHMYDPATDTWTEKAPMPVATSELGSCVIDGLIYVMEYTVTQAYNPATNTWRRLETSKPAFTLGSFPSIAAIDGKAYCFGGNMSANHIYDPAEDSTTGGSGAWSRTASMPSGRTNLSAVAFNGKVYCLGGRTGGASSTSRVEIYDPATDTWSDGPNMRSARSSFEGTSNEHAIYVVGGMNAPIWQYTAEKFALPSDTSVSEWKLY